MAVNPRTQIRPPESVSRHSPPTIAIMDLSTTKEKATAFAKSYGAAMELKLRQPSASNHEIAVGLASHYNPTSMVSFSLGAKHEVGSDDTGIAGVKMHLDNFVKHGLGVDIRLAKSRIEPVAPGTALCWITWTIHPPSDSTVG